MTVLEVAHQQAGLELLRDNVSIAAVYDGALPSSVDEVVLPYLLVYTTVEWPNADPDNGLDGRSGTCLTTWYVHAVGANVTASLAISGQARTSLLDVRPTIAGRQCGLIRQESTQPSRRDETLGQVVQDTVTVYTLRTRPG